eukprot:CFRG8439T1
MSSLTLLRHKNRYIQIFKSEVTRMLSVVTEDQLMLEDIVKNSLNAHDIRFVRLTTCDVANVIRNKAVHISSIESKFMKGGGITWPSALMSIPVVVDMVSPHSGQSVVGEVIQRPDWSTLQKLPYYPRHSRVFGDFYTAEGEVWDLCPRNFLKKMVAEAKDLGFEIKAAFEPEWYLLKLKEDETIIPVDHDLYASTIAADKNMHIIDEIVDALCDQGITIEMYHPECGPGQQEIVVKYTNALMAADQNVIYRETVKAIASKHGLVASFVPKVFSKHPGSGNHIHISVWKDGVNVIGDVEADSLKPHPKAYLSKTAQWFVAGILYSLSALMPLVAPSTNSYRRLQPQMFTGAYTAWGSDNKEAAICVPTNPRSHIPTNVEIKPVDGSANPYMALGGIIAAGLDGIRNQRPLQQECLVDPSELSESEQAAVGISRLPNNVGTAVEDFQASDVLKSALGPMVKLVSAVRLYERDVMEDMTLKDEVRVTLVNVEKGHKAVVLVKNTYEAVIEASRNKLRLGGRSSHNAKRNNTQTSTKVVDDRSLFVWTLSPRAMLLEEDTLSLRNGDTVYISKYPPPEGSVPESSSSESSSVKSVRENSSFPTQILIPVTSDASHVIARVEKTMHIPTPAPTSVHPCQPEISFTHGHEQEQPKTMDRKNTRKNIRTDATYHGNPGQGPGCLTFDWFSCVEGKGVELHYSWVESGVPGDNLATDSSEIGKTRKRHSRLHNKTPTRTGRQFRASLDTYLPESCAFAVGMAIASWLVMGYAAEELHVRCGLLNEQQKQFWVTLYQNALSEFYYINDIPVPDFKITCEGPLIDPYGVTVETAVADVGDIKLTNGPKRALVPLGGGKDSLVALERLRASGYECTLLYVGGEPGEYIANWRLPALVSATGCDVLLVELDLGDCWTAEFEHDKADVKMITPPFSALVAFISAGIAAMN